jgi:hypothetical protein
MTEWLQHLFLVFGVIDIRVPMQEVSNFGAQRSLNNADE